MTKGHLTEELCSTSTLPFDVFVAVAKMAVTSHPSSKRQIRKGIAYNDVADALLERDESVLPSSEGELHCLLIRGGFKADGYARIFATEIWEDYEAARASVRRKVRQ
jgi:hypothetical protein